MKFVIAILLLSFVAVTFAQFACVSDDDCVRHCHQHTECRDGVCHCHHAPVNVGRRQPCADHDSCTCADGTSGHCDHAGVCHCHH